MAIPTKRCIKCGTKKPATLEYFHFNHSCKDNLRTNCKECVREYRKQYRLKNAQRERRQQKERYWANRDRESQRIRVWGRNNRHKTYVSDQRRIGRLGELPCTFTDEDETRALAYFYGCCAVCSRPMRDLFGERTVSMDHWIPISSQDCPGTIPSNIIPMCHGVSGCNNKKSNRDPVEWLVSEFGKKKAKKILKRVNEFFSHVREGKKLTGKHEREPDHDT